MTAFLKYMDAQFWKPSDISGLAHSSSSPLPTRVSCVPCQDCKDGSGPSAPFTFPELVASQGDPSADAALAWLDAIPLKLLEEQNVSCQALRDELRRSRQENVVSSYSSCHVMSCCFPSAILNPLAARVVKFVCINGTCHERQLRHFFYLNPGFMALLLEEVSRNPPARGRSALC